jgi:hypothetical protein
LNKKNLLQVAHFVYSENASQRKISLQFSGFFYLLLLLLLSSGGIIVIPGHVM